jgi:outer membrane receptor protein involved in Fe transport
LFATHVLTQVQRYALGAKGTLVGTWTWDAYVQLGHNNYDRDDYHNRITQNYLNAVDAVVSPATGQIVCRSTLTHPNNGCVPADVFGQGSISAAAVAYYTGTSWENQRQEQNVYAFKTNGQLFDTWAGTASGAAGAEYRKESIDVDVDPISAASGWRQVNAQPLEGAYNVKEGFIEVGVPLAKDAFLAHLLDIDGAARQTDYSTSGNVTTWKAGINYEPIAALRLRSTVSRDIRAPNLNELFSGQNELNSPLIDPVTNVQRSVPQFTGGNPHLVPERGLTRTFGFIFQPNDLTGLRLSVDYYSIVLTNAITTLTAQQVLDGCYLQGEQTLCSQISRDATGALSQVRATQLNASELKTHGIDYEVGYTTYDVGPGRLSMRALATYVGELATTINGTTTDTAGQVGATGGIPHWMGNVFAGYQVDKYDAGILYRYVEGGTYQNSYVQGVDINNNHVGGRSYIDLNGSYKVAEWLDLFAKVNNLCNIAPPATPTTVTQALYAGSAYYDRIGRYYILGVRVRF